MTSPVATGADIDSPASHTDDSEPPSITLREAVGVWAKIGVLSFGGPAGQIALMHRILVDEKRWISNERFLHALNFCMLLPGPEAQQLATYIGWLFHKVRGGLIAGTLFVLPGFVVILALSYVYVAVGNVPLVQGLFTGLKSAVIVIVLQAVIRIGRRSLTSTVLVVLAVIAFLAMFVWKVPFPLVIAFAAVVGAIATRHGGQGVRNADAVVSEPGVSIAYVFRTIALFGTLWFVPVALLAVSLGPDNVFTNIALFFSKMAVVTFGGAYAVLGYVSQEAVGTYHWLTPGEMIDGLALAETTPGPLIMVTQFVGFVAAYRDPGSLTPGIAALLGGALTTWVTFLPCFLWIFVGAPYIEQLRRNRVLAGALAGVTAAVVGVIVNLALWFSIHALFGEVSPFHFAGASVELPDWPTLRAWSLLITAMAAVFAFRFRASMMTILGLSGALGMVPFFNSYFLHQ